MKDPLYCAAAKMIDEAFKIMEFRRRGPEQVCAFVVSGS